MIAHAVRIGDDYGVLCDRLDDVDNVSFLNPELAQTRVLDKGVLGDLTRDKNGGN